MLKLIAPIFLVVSLLAPAIAYAHCPLCTAATGSAVAVARWYGVDDLITGTLIGGFLLSTAAWFSNILQKRNKGKEYFPFQFYILVLGTLVATILSLYITSFAFTDKLFLGIITGSAVTIFAFHLHDVLRHANRNKNFFPFQVIILTLMLLLLTNTGFYLIGWI